jgi:hypothetical protein
LEHYTEQHSRSIAHAHGCILLKLSPFGMAGIPDRILLMPGGRVMFIEFKADGKYLKPLQRWWRDRLQALGFRVEVCRSSAEFRRLLDSEGVKPQTASVGQSIKE